MTGSSWWWADGTSSCCRRRAVRRPTRSSSGSPDFRTALTGNLFGPLFGHVPNLVTMRGDRYRDALSVHRIA